MRLVDFSSEIHPGMPKPPSAPEVTMRYTISQSEDAEARKGFSNKLEEYTMTTHVATHFDAPSHFTTKGKNIDQFALDRFFMVPSLMLNVKKGEYGEISVKDLEEAQKEAGEIKKGDLVYLNTGFFRFYGEETYLKTPYLTEEAARYLANAGVSIVAIDCFTVDDVRKKEKPAHVVLLKEYGIPIIECALHLDDAPKPRFSSVWFPLKIRDGSGAFTRLVGVFGEGDVE